MGGLRDHPLGDEWVVTASFAQERLWFLQCLEPDQPTYNLIVNIALSGPIDVRALEQSLATIVGRHEVLRTTFVAFEGTVRQRVSPPGPVELPSTDLSRLPRHRAEQEARRLVAADAAEPFDLAAGPLLRPRLIVLADDEQLLSVVAHHIVFDQWSARVLRSELLAAYAALRAGRAPSLPPLPIQFADYATWQRGWLSRQTLDGHLDYWRGRLAGLPTLDLPTDRPRPPVRSSAGATLAFTVPAGLGGRLRALAGGTGCSLFMVLLAAFQAVLARHAEQRDVAVGVPVAGRTHPDVEALVGFFVNTLVLRTDLSGDPSLLELLERVRAVALDAYAHQDLPFEHLVQVLAPDRDRSRNPLFDLMFNFRTGTGVDGCGFGPTTAKFDLTLDVTDPAGGEHQLNGEIEYSTELFDRPTIERLAADYLAVLGAMAAEPARRLEDLLGSIEPLPATVRGAGRSTRRLVAYVVPADRDDPPSAAELRAFLERELPGPLVPAIFVTLDALPLNSSGKVDRRALPPPDAVPAGRPAGHRPPRTPTERALAEIWREVLGVDLVGADDGFFELGGHSLLATQLVVRTRARLRVDLPLAAVFDAPTLAGLAARIDAAVRVDPLPPIARVGRNRRLVLSQAQQRLWLLNQLDPGSPEYNSPVALRLLGPLDTGALRRALDEIVARHEVLRTTIGADADGPVQVVHPRGPVDLPVTDLSGLPPARAMAEARELVDVRAREPFDLTVEPPLRLHLVRLGADDHVLGLNLYHIASDRWSEDIFRRELAVLYAAFRDGRPSPLPPLPIQYRDYAEWQREWLSGDVLRRQLDHWCARLADLPTVDLPTDRPRPPVRTAAGAAHWFTVPDEVAGAVRALGRHAGVSTFMVLLAALHTLLARYTGRHDIAVGTPIAIRGHPDTEGLIGFFINKLVLRTDLSGDPTVAELLARERAVTLDAYAHQDVPFEHLIDALQPERDRSRPPLVQVVLDFETTAVPAPPPDDGGLAFADFPVGCATAKADLRVIVTETGGGLQCGFEYSTDLFERPTVERMARHFGLLLAEITVDPDRRIGELPVLVPAEEAQFAGWERGPVAPAGRGVPDLVAAHAAATPDAVAVIDGGRELSYRELAAGATRLAARLWSAGVRPEVTVGVCLEPGVDLVVAVLGIWAAGATYLPLDPAAPLPRLAFLIDDAPADVLVSTTVFADRLPGSSAPLVLLDEPGNGEAGAYEPGDDGAGAPVGAPHQDNAAYLIYTSGSTGTPKGVAVTYRGLANLVQAQRRLFGVTAADRVLQFAPTSFDASVAEIAVALAAGATLVVATPQHRRDPGLLGRLVTRHRVSVATLPPAELAVLDPAEVHTLRTVVSAGERLPPHTAARWHGDTRRLLNAYGPTETSVCATTATCDPTDTGAPPIGTPIDNTTAQVLDERLCRVPVGVAGELFLGGAHLARGYPGRAALTAAAFVADPFTGNGSRLYRTGDLACWRDDGRLEYLGRTDHQLKIRGHRVEPAEVEAALVTHPEVDGAVVAAYDGSLVGYVVPVRPEEPPAPGELRAFLAARLPDHLVPSGFVPIGALPRTPSGKVDRRALPAPGTVCGASARDQGEPPQTATEHIVADLWRDILRQDRVGRDDDFFDLGGHSLLATMLVARVRDQLDVDLPVATVFDAPTLAGWAALVEDALVEDIARLPEHEVRRLLAPDGRAS